jgi:hypothetical protein
MHTKIIAVVILFLTTMTGTAQIAQQGGSVLSLKHFKFESLIAEVDIDKNGEMTKTEWENAGLADRFFAICDVNRDSKLSKREMKNCELPQVMDSNRDNVLTAKEMLEYEKKTASQK